MILTGRKCCILPRAPYCLDTSWSASTVALLVPIACLAILPLDLRPRSLTLRAQVHRLSGVILDLATTQQGHRADAGT